MALGALYGAPSIEDGVRRRILERLQIARQQQEMALAGRSADRADQALAQQGELTRLMREQQGYQQAVGRGEKLDQSIPGDTVLQGNDPRLPDLRVGGASISDKGIAPQAPPAALAEDPNAKPPTDLPGTITNAVLPPAAAGRLYLKDESAQQQNIRIDNERAQAAKDKPKEASISNVMSLVREGEKVRAPVRMMERSLRIMRSGLAQARAGNMNPGSQDVLVTFQKILDPNSVVRESEYARSAEGQAFLTRIEGFYQRLKQGGPGMTLPELEGFVTASEDMLRSVQTHGNSKRKQLEAIASQYGVDPSLVWDPGDPSDTPPPPPAGKGGGDHPPMTKNGWNYEWTGDHYKATTQASAPAPGAAPNVPTSAAPPAGDDHPPMAKNGWNYEWAGDHYKATTPASTPAPTAAAPSRPNPLDSSRYPEMGTMPSGGASQMRPAAPAAAGRPNPLDTMRYPEAGTLPGPSPEGPRNPLDTSRYPEVGTLPRSAPRIRGNVISQPGKEALQEREGGFVADPYPDVSGLAIGYGMHEFQGKPVTPGMHIDQPQADAEMDQQIKAKYGRLVDEALRVPVSQDQYDALVSMAWNLPAAAKRVIGKLNRGEPVSDQDFQVSATVHGQPHKGLQHRRTSEASQFMGTK